MEMENQERTSESQPVDNFYDEIYEEETRRQSIRSEYVYSIENNSNDTGVWEREFRYGFPALQIKAWDSKRSCHPVDCTEACVCKQYFFYIEQTTGRLPS